MFPWMVYHPFQRELRENAMLSLQQLNCFLAAVRHGTFSKAAQALDISQPSLSAQVLKLEQALGTSLFIRTNRRLMLTEAGRRLYPFAQTCTAASAHGFEAVQSVRNLESGVASFGTFGSAHHYFLPELIAEFRREHPTMRIRVVGYNSSEVARAVSEGELEAGLVMIPVNEPNLVAGEPLWSTQIGYISADPKRLETPKTIAELAHAPLILSDARWNTQDPVRRLLAERAQQEGVVLDPVIEVEHQQTAFELAAMGLGDMIATRPIMHQLGFQHRLGWVPIEPPMFEVFAFIRRHDSPLSTATRVLMAKMRAHLERIQRTYARFGDGFVQPG